LRAGVISEGVRNGLTIDLVKATSDSQLMASTAARTIAAWPVPRGLP
jgi:hypothetical protein